MARKARAEEDTHDALTRLDEDMRDAWELEITTENPNAARKLRKALNDARRAIQDAADALEGQTAAARRMVE